MITMPHVVDAMAEDNVTMSVTNWVDHAQIPFKIIVGIARMGTTLSPSAPNPPEVATRSVIEP